jgi:hypothetical protein
VSGRLSERQDSGGASAPRATFTGGASAPRAAAKKTSSRGRSETASSLLLSWPAVTYKTIKKRNQQFCLVQIRSRIFFFFFRSVNLGLLSSSWLAVPSSCW